MNFKTKQMLFVFIGAIVALVALTGIGYYRMHLLSSASLVSQKKTLLDDYDGLIKSQVETAVSILTTIEARAAKREISVDEAKRLGADLVRQLRFQKDGYFWIDTVDGTNIVLLGKPSEGINRIDLQDKNGKFIIREIIRQGTKDGGGYTDYWFPKAGSDIPLPKRSYSLEFKPWQWVVGTGNYIDDINNIMSERHKASHQEFVGNIGFFAGSTAIIILIFIGAGFLMYVMMKAKDQEIESADKKIADLNRRFSLAVDSAKIGVWDWDIAENRLAWDTRMFALYGVAEKDASRAYAVWKRGVHPDDRERGTVAIEQALRGEKDFEGEFRVVWPDGEIRHLMVSALVLRDADGKPLRMIGVNYDITERRLAEETRRNLARAVEQCPVTIVITDTDGTIEFVNPRFTELTGYTSEEAIGQNPRVLKSGDTPPEVFAELWSTISTGKTWEGNFVNKSKDGTLFWEHAVISPLLDETGAITHYLAVKEDVTEKRKILEELTAARDTAEAATMAKSQFLATMSHEIRTPMNGVIGMAGLLLETELSDEQRGYAEIVNRSGENLLSLINDILDFSKIEAGRLDIEILNFDLRITLEDIVEMLTFRAQDAGLELICHIDPAVPTHLKGDPGRLRQIITNLAGNAIKFTHAGEVVIGAELESEQGEAVIIRFSVRDTGIGIPQSRLAAIFEPFTQADGSTTRKYGGTGLGLAICKQLTELMGGEIGIESEEGNGSTFWFTARFEKQNDGEKKNIVALPYADIKHNRILVVDDNATNRKLMATLLSDWGCSYELVADGMSALQSLRKAVAENKPFQIAMLDQEMPGMDGSELGRQVKADPQLQATLLIMVTSLAQRGEAAALEKIGFVGYLSKPVRQSQLYSCIALALDRTRASAPSTALITRHTVAEVVNHGLRILLAEDNVINQKVAQSILGKLGYKADVVADGLEAVRALEMMDYDIVLMDCQMPEMDGFAATAVIRDPHSHVRNHLIPIIAMTANAMQGDREHCIAAGMNDYLTKPVKKDELAVMLERWGDYAKATRGGVGDENTHQEPKY